MFEIFTACAVVVAYSLCAVMQILVLAGRVNIHKKIIVSVAAVGVVLHFILISDRLLMAYKLNVHLFEMASIIAWLVMALLVFSSLRKPVEQLFTGAAPVALGSVILWMVIPAQERELHQLDAPLFWHIFLSLLAYSIFMLATIQAALLWLQVRLLKSHHIRNVINTLPPLQTMDALLIEMIWLGMVLLTVALVVGIPSITNLSGQHLIHKTVFALCGWAIFAILLLGHHRYGWRGVVTSRWTLLGSLCFMLSYIGSKFVLEVLLT